MKKTIMLTLAFLSLNSFAASSGSYDCKIVSSASTKAYEAGPAIYVLVSGLDITISGKDISTCSAKGKLNKMGLIEVSSAMKNCGIDGVDMLIPVDMQRQNTKSSLVVSANESFDVYACKLNAMIEF